MYFPAAATRLLRIGLILALMLGVVLRPSLAHLADLHADEHRILAAHVAHESAGRASDGVHHDGADAAAEGSESRNDGHGLHALMHLSWSGGGMAYLTSTVVTAHVHPGATHPWRPLPALGPAVRLPGPLRPPIA